MSEARVEERNFVTGTFEEMPRDVFDRHSLKYSMLHCHFLFRELRCDESFSSFFNELWTLCDEIAAIIPIHDDDNERLMISSHKSYTIR